MGSTIFVGCGFLVIGLSLLLFNRQIARVQKQDDELFGMGPVSVRFNRTSFLIVGVVMCLMGAFILAFIGDH